MSTPLPSRHGGGLLLRRRRHQRGRPRQRTRVIAHGDSGEEVERHLRQCIRWPEIFRGWCSESAVGEHRDRGAGLLHHVKIKIGQ